MKAFYGIRWGLCVLFTLLVDMSATCVFAGKLDASSWQIGQLNAPPLPPSGLYVVGGPTNPPSSINYLSVLSDNNPSTLITLTNSGNPAKPPGLLIDLGQTMAVHRVLVNGANNGFLTWPNWQPNQGTPPLGLIVAYVGDTPNTTNRQASWTIPYDAGNPVDTEADIRFSPARGRYVRLELQTQVSWGFNYWPGFAIGSLPTPVNVNWNVGEVEVYGCSGPATNENAVVLPSGSPAPLVLAANELSYYLGELTGKPHPIIQPNQTNLYSGTLYTIVDLKSLAPTYATMTNNMANGQLPGGVNIKIQGRQVIFSAWPYRCVLWSVWEFLERQGIRWLYPDAHGDYVPVGAGVSLAMLPLQFTPSAQSIYANWDAACLQPWPPWQLQSVRQGYLYPWRNRWYAASSCNGPLGGSEIPALPSPGGTLNSDYSEQFVGYPHNFGSVVPVRILQQHTNWWGYNPSLGYRVDPNNSSATAFCMDNPELISWVANKLVAVAAYAPIPCQSPLTTIHWAKAFNLLPIDATLFCECTNWCLPANGPFQTNNIGWVSPYYPRSMSSMYFNFVNAVATNVANQGSKAIVGALAYGDDCEPPVTISKMSTNVQVEVCFYGAPNLGMAAPQNSDVKDQYTTWASKCSRLSTYDYALLHDDYWQPSPLLPVPLIAGTVDRAQFLSTVGALDGGSQATIESIPYNPWNFYAYPRIRWNTSQSAGQLAQEFFNGFFREVANPMYNYYTAMENYQYSNNINLHLFGYCYTVTPGSFPLSVLSAMQTSLITAEQTATSWVTSNRVANVRAGFDWLMAKRGLTPGALTNLAPYAVVPSSGTFTVDLSRMVKADRSPASNGAYWENVDWWFGSAATLQQTLNFAQAGTYKMVVHYKATAYQGVSPILNVMLGPSQQSVSLTSSTYTNYTFMLNVPAQAWDLVLNFENQAPAGARSFYIDSVQLTRQ